MNGRVVLLLFICCLPFITAIEGIKPKRELKGKYKGTSSKAAKITKVGKRSKGGSTKLIKSSKSKGTVKSSKGKGGKSNSQSCQDFKVTGDGRVEESGFQITGVVGLPVFIPPQGIGIATLIGEETIDANTSVFHSIATLMFDSSDFGSAAPVIFEGQLDTVESPTNVEISANLVLSGYFIPTGGIVTGQMVFDINDDPSTEEFNFAANATLCSTDSSIFN